MKQIVFFSNNLYKTKEVTKILEKTDIKILTLNDFPKVNEPDETGNSFKENAIIKSSFGFNKFSLPCFADDSGICVSALNYKPGIKSKTFQEENGGYDKSFKIIINRAKEKNDYNAFFQTSIAFTDKIHSICFNGKIYGKISSKPLGLNGFHYDPIFIPQGFNKTFAEMSAEEKNKISHRAIALKKLKKFLYRYSFN